MLKIQMRVNLRGANVGVAEHFLHGTQIAATLQYVARKTMAQHVRMRAGVDALLN